MRTSKMQMMCGMVLPIFVQAVLFNVFAAGIEPSSNDSSDEHPAKIRHGRRLGKYKYREEVIKRVEFNHPCRLAQTAVKVTFPGMKSEVLVSFLGYKEPNLMHVMRCKGLCSNKALSPVACVATKKKLKMVKMRLKTQVLGSDAKEKFQELVLEEHDECGCQCLSISHRHCIDPVSFNNETCSCACDNSPLAKDQLQCEAYSGRKWDGNTCTCRHKDKIIVYKDSLSGDGFQDSQGNLSADHHVSGSWDQVKLHSGRDLFATQFATMVNSTLENSHASIKTWTVIGICSFIISILLSTTYYYRRKSRSLQFSTSMTPRNSTLTATISSPTMINMTDEQSRH